MQQMWEEIVTRLTLGDLFSCVMQVSLREDANGKQKSAEVVVMKKKSEWKKKLLQTIFS